MASSTERGLTWAVPRVSSKFLGKCSPALLPAQPQGQHPRGKISGPLLSYLLGKTETQFPFLPSFLSSAVDEGPEPATTDPAQLD